LQACFFNSRNVYVYASVSSQVLTANDSPVKANARSKCDELHFLLSKLALILIDLKTSAAVILAPKGIGVIDIILFSKLRYHFNSAHYTILGVVGHIEP